jgi:phage shock protein C
MGGYRNRSSRHREKARWQYDGHSDRGLYRSRNGIILGVFKGLAQYFGFSVGWLRTIGVIVFIFSGFWPVVVLYLLAALIMKQAPVIPLDSLDEKEFYDSYTYCRKGAVNRLKRRYENLNRRIQRMEDVVTDREFDWEQRLNS